MSNAVIVHQHDVSEIERMARAFAASKLFGMASPEQAIALCLIAQAEGRHPASAAQDYHIIQNKPSKKSDAMLRDFLASGGKVSDWHLTDERVSATFSHPAGGTVTIDWDMARAKKAGITNPMWNKYPRQMLRARVVSEGVRTVFPMATSGMYVPEEVIEFEPQKQRENPDAALGPDTTVIEGKVKTNTNPDALPKAKAREVYEALQQELNACTSQADIAGLCASKAFGAEVKKLPSDWLDLLTQQKDELWAAFAPKAGHVEPNFDEMEGAIE
jgi:hypothetical protein